MKVEVKGNNEEVKIKKYEGEGIIVGEAVSTDKQIRFYLNETTFISATKEQDSDNEEKIVVDLADNEEKYFRSISADAKADKGQLKKDIRKTLIGIGVLIVVLVSCFTINIEPSNFLLRIILQTFSIFLYFLISVGMFEYMMIPSSARSKHSAEHKIVNFIMKNSRLPQNMKEIKKSSRFTVGCDSIEKEEVWVKAFVACIFADLYVSCSFIIIYLIFPNIELVSEKILLIAYLITYLVIAFINIRMILKGNYKKIINILMKGMNYFLQCFNTTNKVEETDILLAFYAAKYWVKRVYPEYYTDNDLTYH